MAPPLKQRKSQSPVSIVVDHASVSATTTAKVWKAPVGRRCRITSVAYNSVGGLAADASNYFTITLKNGAGTVMATWSTLTGQEGTLPNNTFASAFTLSATDANRVLAGADTLTLTLTLTGTQTLPIGKLAIHLIQLD